VIVESNELERALSRLAGNVPDRRAGLFGPGSWTWTLSREGIVFLGGPRAALLQLAHPVVAQAVTQHSRATEDTFGRFLRTFEHVFAMVYGDLDSAFASARRVHSLHERVRGAMPQTTGSIAAGTRYEANTPEVLLWIHATLLETTVEIYEQMLWPLSDDEKDAYYAETKRFAALFGIPDALIPPDWPAFEAYWHGMLSSPEITVSDAARRLARSLLRPPDTWIGPVWDWLRAITARLMPPRQREEFGLAFGSVEQAVAESSLGALRAAWWLLPGSLRWLPAYRDAMRRLDRRAGRDPIGIVLDQIVRLARGWR
jgi:uncharacterized protein (DUF2236 family)